MAIRKLYALIFIAGLTLACRDNRVEVAHPELIKDKQKRIALLIRDLENVQATPMMSFSYNDFGASPEVQALVAQGEDAVDPLIDCLDHDYRLTRSIDQGRSSANSRVIGVEEPAFAALQAILKCHDQFPWPAELYVKCTPGMAHLERAELAAKIREYWNKYRDKTQPERWYGILLDDHATTEAWAEAAGNIVLPDNQDLFAGYGMIRMVNHPRNPDAPVVCWGEILRGKKNPSVSELLVKRLKESRAEPTAKSFLPFAPSEKLAKALAKWDGKNQLESLRWHCGELQKIILLQTDNNGPGQIDDLITTYLERIEAGDTQAMGEYAKWVRAADAVKLNNLAHLYGAIFFSPLWSYPQDPVAVETAKWLFQDAHSPWSLGPADPDPTWTIHSAHIPLIGLPVFRAMVLQQLQDKRVVGHTEVTSPQNMMVKYNTAPGSGFYLSDAPAVGTKNDFRLCDAIGFSVSTIRGAPECEPYWTEVQRDHAVQETVLFLRRNGNRLLRKTNSQDKFGYDPLCDPIR